MKEADELEVLALAVHGGLAVGHLLGAIYNTRRKQRLDAAIHLGTLAYELGAVWRHYTDIKQERNT